VVEATIAELDVENAVIEPWAGTDDRADGVRAEVGNMPIGSACTFTNALMQEQPV
jgi:hypothetical protein